MIFLLPKENDVETVVLLGDKRVDGHIRIDVDVEKLANTGGRATYADIKDIDGGIDGTDTFEIV